MNNKKTKQNSKIIKGSEQADYFYLNEEVLDYDFADYVKVRSFPRGFILSFGKWHPEKKKYGLFEEILLPFEIAHALGKIIDKQINELKDKGLLEIREMKEDK